MFNQFNRHFAFQGEHGEDWAPPWLNNAREWHGHGFRGWRGPFGPRFFGMRRGPFGPGGPFGPEGRGGRGFGPGEGRRFFGRGDMKFALLALLQERPMHGYEMIKALEEKSGGFYAPSAGSVYPTLQMLEDRSFVTSSEVEGKRIYTITDTGRAFLNENQKESEEFAGPPWARAFGHGNRQPIAEVKALRSEAMEVARLLAIAARMSFNNPEHITRLRGIIERARKDLSDMIYSTENKQEQPSTPSVDQV